MSLNFPSCERELRKRFSSKNVYWNGERITTSRLRFGESSDNSREQLQKRLLVRTCRLISLMCDELPAGYHLRVALIFRGSPLDRRLAGLPTDAKSRWFAGKNRIR